MRTKTLRALSLLCAASAAFAFQNPKPEDAEHWAKQAQAVTIIRDDWGIAHVYGKTDADAVFGMIYAQAEDDFNRIETNYLNAMGRLAEAEGESKIYSGPAHEAVHRSRGAEEASTPPARPGCKN